MEGRIRIPHVVHIFFYIVQSKNLLLYINQYKSVTIIIEISICLFDILMQNRTACGAKIDELTRELLVTESI